MIRLLSLAVALVSFSLGACATMTSGTTQTITVDSNPPGAKVFVGTRTTRNGESTFYKKGEVGVTPISVLIPRKDGALRIEAEGYEAADVPLERKMNPWVWGDIVLTSLLSTSIDTSTGASNEYDPGEYFIELVPLAAAGMPAGVVPEGAAPEVGAPMDDPSAVFDEPVGDQY